MLHIISTLTDVSSVVHVASVRTICVTC